MLDKCTLPTVLTNEQAAPTRAWKYEAKSLQELVGLFDAHPSSDQPEADLRRKINQPGARRADQLGRSQDKQEQRHDYGHDFRICMAAHSATSLASTSPKNSCRLCKMPFGRYLSSA
ncbi:hypothetical protein PGT21_029647 [Puccinia graminis f. sp. tritici]|uniref:Uncharacterized protein n=1 Tax=Puccinia graminis f. sp. tritici TaxID=56615 RepID=A0A5B0QC46_PUCGR|nr:hypothetical protein PGT21_029647 [Puccinia graminis f. sp. tritici]